MTVGSFDSFQSDKLGKRYKRLNFAESLDSYKPK